MGDSRDSFSTTGTLKTPGFEESEVTRPGIPASNPTEPKEERRIRARKSSFRLVRRIHPSLNHSTSPTMRSTLLTGALALVFAFVTSAQDSKGPSKAELEQKGAAASEEQRWDDAAAAYRELVKIDDKNGQ